MVAVSALVPLYVPLVVLDFIRLVIAYVKKMIHHVLLVALNALIQLPVTLVILDFIWVLINNV